MQNTSTHWHGSLAMVAGMGLYMFGDVFMKFVLGTMPVFQIQAMRGVVCVLACLVLIAALGQGKHIMQVFNPWIVLRGIFEIAASFGFYAAITYLPLADVTAIVQTCPLLLIVGAAIFYGEKLGLLRILLVIVGIIGALLVAQPGTTAASSYALLGFVVALAVVGRDLVIRKVPADVPAFIPVLALALVVTIASAISTLAFETQVMPTAQGMMFMSISAVILVLGHAGVYLAYKLAPAKSVAPFMYSLTVWAVMFGIIFFGDVPNPLALVGMALIITAGLLIIYLDARAPEKDQLPV